MSIEKLVIATGNSGKRNEIINFLELNTSEILKNIEIVTPNIEFLPAETGETFQENALQKALHAFKQTGVPTLAEDSGIEVFALPRELGVKTRRWGAGENATDEQWIEYFLKVMKNKTERGAHFFTSACLVLSLDEIYIVSGNCKGEILQESNVPLAKGIPLSSYFVPEGFSKTFTELSIEEKNNISHRGNAMKKVKNILERISL